MNSGQIYSFLKNRHSINFIYHANSVGTANTQLRLGGLASREYVESRNLHQTNQYTDVSDKEVGVWNDIFMDSIDIHKRIHDRNKYGPVLFELNIEILTKIPNNACVLITKSNPSKWTVQTSFQDRYFTQIEELTNMFMPGNFDQMITISNLGLMPFGNNLKTIILDDPILERPSPSQLFNNAHLKLIEGVNSPPVINRRLCGTSCKCFNSYGLRQTRIPYFF